MKENIDDIVQRVGKLDHPQVIATALGAGSAYLAEMFADMRLLDYPLNDLRMLGEQFGRRRSWPLVGTAMHYSFSIFLTYIYAAYGHDRLPGPDWLRGLIFINIENGTLYPFAPLLDRFNPTIHSGEMPAVFTRTGFVNQFLRHAAFGLTLGALYRPKKR
jgi:hypothetical protein